MTVRVLCFGVLRDLLGRSEDQLELAENSPLQAVFDHYARLQPRLREMAGSVVLARNHEFSPGGTLLQDGDEVALMPPVSGGLDRYTHVLEEAGGHFFALTRQPIDTAALSRHVKRGEDGALVQFEGVVRNNTKGRATLFLDYECYAPMAVRMMAQIGREIAESQAIGRIAMVHRLGRMEIGEASVVIVVSAPHRRPAFEAALEGINRLKRLVPIWKKEHFADGEVWVDGEWDESVRTAAQGQDVRP